MEKALIMKNTDKAQAFIDKLENEYIPILNGIVSGVKALDLPAPSKEQVKKILNGDFSELSSAYNRLIKADVSGFKTSAAKAEINASAGRKLESFITKTRESLSLQIDNYKPYDAFLLDLFEIDENERAIISDEGLEKIEKAFEEKISEPKYIRTTKKLEAAGAALQDLWDSLVSTGIADRMAPFTNYPKQLLMNLFDVETTEEEENEGLILKHKIVPKKINFEYLTKS